MKKLLIATLIAATPFAASAQIEVNKMINPKLIATWTESCTNGEVNGVPATKCDETQLYIWTGQTHQGLKCYEKRNVSKKYPSSGTICTTSYQHDDLKYELQSIGYGSRNTPFGG
ncbi:exported hypothetical protein [Vibrio chagasii]|nr:exported hypothetical protein [Vibrio chagasii]